MDAPYFYAVHKEDVLAVIAPLRNAMRTTCNDNS